MSSSRSHRRDWERGSSGSPERTIGSTERKRKQRQPLSCAECRRLKLKCDRQTPCSNCERRGCSELCPNETRPPTKASFEETSELRERLAALERLLGDQVPNLSNANGPNPHIDQAHQEPSRMFAKSSGAMDRPSEPEGEGGHTGDEGALAAFAIAHSIGGSSSGPVFDVSSILDQPLVFDYNTTPQDHQMQVSQGQGSRSLVPLRSAPSVSPQDLAHGTLVLGKSGETKYFGHTAASEWLKNQEIDENGEGTSPRPSRLQSPHLQRSGDHDNPTIFPFSMLAHTTSMSTLMSCLPDMYEARVLVDSYFRYFSWNFNVAPRTVIEKLIADIYAIKHDTTSDHRVIEPQSLALLFIVLAVGALHNLELPPNDPSAGEYLSHSKRALARSDFLTRSTISGIQTLHIMAHYHLYVNSLRGLEHWLSGRATEKGRNGDSAWPLWGIAIRLIQAMGLHRDGTKWNLDQQTVEVRSEGESFGNATPRMFSRRIASPDRTAYIRSMFTPNTISSSIAPQYIDTAFPTGPSDAGADPCLRHDLLKFELSKISAQVLDHAMRVDAPPYSSVLSLHDKLVQFECNIPHALRCRAVLLALPSIYPDSDSAIRDSPELTKKDMRRTLQQFTLALNVSESLLFLNRPYFARALHERKPDPTQTEFGQSYLCVVERCNVMIQICATIYPLYPSVISRHWFFWYHVFNAAVTMGTLILGDPRNVLASYALSLIDSAIGLYTTIIQGNSTARLLRNLEWLLKLRQRASSKMILAASFQADYSSRESDEGDDVELIGWRTRLIQRLGKSAHLATTITPTQSAATPSPNTAMAQTISQALQQHFVPDNGLDVLTDSRHVNVAKDQGTDMLLHQFWDPMMLQEQSSSSGDPIASVDWWNWEPSAGLNQGI